MQYLVIALRGGGGYINLCEYINSHKFIYSLREVSNHNSVPKPRTPSRLKTNDPATLVMKCPCKA